MPNALIGIMSLKALAKNAAHVVLDVTAIATALLLKL